MSDYDSLREDLHAAVAAMSNYAAAVNRKEDAVTVELERIWTDVAELRDEVVALANRLEALTNFVVTSPAEVAERILRVPPTIQSNVEQIVREHDQPVTAGDVLAELPTDTKREAVNYALWSAAQKGKLRRLRHGLYVAGEDDDA